MTGSIRRWQGIPSILLLLALWQAGAMLAGSRLLPGPMAVFTVMAQETASGELPFHLGFSLARVGIAFVVAMIVGTAIGLVLGRSRGIDRWLYPWLIVLLNIPALIVIILTYIWMGLTEAALLIAVAVNKIPSVAVTLREGAGTLDRDFAEVAQIYEFGPLKTLRTVVLPQLAPYLLAAARNGLSLVWKIVLVAELLGRSNGVGFQLQTYFQLFDVPRVMAYAIAFVGCVLVLEAFLFRPVEQSAGQWRRQP
ncbi:ABC transporter permease [Microvirga thermotolerans]|uniref:ABC transporter permease subunit n=1 Tax=Microvirga thermotolerans TaxID=2651334 RepID=A0A5P9JXC3_9HYPH|nr:ABC transporter permease subunit [Microvirga thermotolerans]QFU17492.1 ABC transporter permease subunit [Microvirga thermotolerans]